MTRTVEGKNKALVLEAFETLFNKKDYAAANASGRRPTFNIASTSRRAAMVCSDWSRLLPRRVVVTAKPSEVHLNPAGTVHGGFAATLLDSCMGLAVWSTLEKGLGQTTLEFKISLVRPITPETGIIRAEGVVLNRGRRVGTAEGRITDLNGRLLAHGTTTCLIFEG
jgi:uncharacterized protein (TIGR00369 family)